MVKIQHFIKPFCILLLFSFNIAIVFAKDDDLLSKPKLYYEIPASVKKLDKSIYVNLENIQTENFIVKVMINGKGPYQFMIDTGVPITMLSKQVAQDLNLQSPQKKEFNGNFTHQTADHYKIKEMTLGDGALYDYDVAVLEEPNIITNFISAHHFNIDGILAIGAFYHYLLTLDYANKRIGLESNSLNKNDKNTIAFAPTDKVPVIEVEFKDNKNTNLTINCVLDSGFSGQFTFPSMITQIPFDIIEGHQVKANAGFKEYIVYKDKIAANAYFSNKVVENPYIVHGQGIYGKSGETFGLMGLDIIHHYRMTIDQQNRLLKIE